MKVFFLGFMVGLAIMLTIFPYRKRTTEHYFDTTQTTIEYANTIDYLFATLQGTLIIALLCCLIFIIYKKISKKQN